MPSCGGNEYKIIKITDLQKFQLEWILEII